VKAIKQDRNGIIPYLILAVTLAALIALEWASTPGLDSTSPALDVPENAPYLQQGSPASAPAGGISAIPNRFVTTYDLAPAILTTGSFSATGIASAAGSVSDESAISPQAARFLLAVRPGLPLILQPLRRLLDPGR
jgi:hypothetical protein